MKSKLGFVARSRAAKERAAEKAEAWAAGADKRRQWTELRDLDRARGDVLSATEAVAEAETAIAKWKASLAQYREHAGLYAEPARIRDLAARLDIAHEAAASRRHALAAAEARLAALMPAPAPASKKVAS